VTSPWGSPALSSPVSLSFERPSSRSWAMTSSLRARYSGSCLWPSDPKGCPVADQIEQIIEPAGRFVLAPTVQLALMFKYPCVRHDQRRPRCVAIQRRPPCHHPCCCSRCRPSPCGRLSRPRSTTTAPPRPDAHSGRCACPPHDRMPCGEGDVRSLPTFTDVRSTGSVPSFTPTASPEPQIAVLVRTSGRPPDTGDRRGAAIAYSCSSTAARPIHQGWRAADSSRGFVHWLSSEVRTWWLRGNTVQLELHAWYSPG
jgi:hypothetical protein